MQRVIKDIEPNLASQAQRSRLRNISLALSCKDPTIAILVNQHASSPLIDDHADGRLGINFVPIWWLVIGVVVRSLGWLRALATRLTRGIRDRYQHVAGSVGGITKYIFDLVLASSALVLLSPLLIIVSVLVRAQIGSPIIFSHMRVGRNGREFPCYKFRTMINNGDAVLAKHLEQNPVAALEWKQNQKLRNDPRVTKLGQILRRTSIDELPQLFNIIVGDMSCVGPRPIVKDELRRYGHYAQEYTRARPGLTGLWQVSGRNSVSYETRVAMDTVYVRRWSVMKDLAIIFRTVPAVLKTDNTS